jgi:hypothetical protein
MSDELHVLGRKNPAYRGGFNKDGVQGVSRVCKLFHADGLILPLGAG